MFAATETTSSGNDALVRAGLVIVMVLLLVAVVWLMRRSWRAKAGAQSAWPQPQDLPAMSVDADRDPASWRLPPVEARFLGSSLAGDWLARVVVHDLGVPSHARLAVDDSGVWVERDGARSFWVPVGSLVGARSDRGIAGRGYERDGVTVLSWRLGVAVIESGFRVTSPRVQAEVVSAVDALVATAPSSSGGLS
jgi:hypothetical protein